MSELPTLPINEYDLMFYAIGVTAVSLDVLDNAETTDDTDNAYRLLLKGQNILIDHLLHMLFAKNGELPDELNMAVIRQHVTQSPLGKLAFDLGIAERGNSKWSH